MKKAVAILVNDIHLDKGNGQLVKDIFGQLTDHCEKFKVKEIWIGGDIFTNRSGQPLSCLTDWKDVIESVQKKNLTLHLIPGNHDKTDQDDERSYLDVYSNPAMKLYRVGTCRLISDKFVVVFIPYFNDEKWLEEYKKVVELMNEAKEDGDIEPDAVKILITHSGFDGVANNDGTLVESAIKPSMFKDWDKVLIGHYHNASKLAENVIYTGSAYQNNYGENITDKGFTLIYDDGSIRFIPSRFPRYIKETLEATDKETLRNLIEKYEGETYDHIRFVFTGKKVDCEKINIAEIQGKYGIDCKFQSTEEAEAIEYSEDDSVLCYDKKAVLKDFFKFCSDNNIKGKKMQYGLNLVKGYVESN